MKTQLMILAATCGSVLLVCSAYAQGTLAPPGTPAPTMKTLQQVEPRTPISGLPYTITNSESHYVTGNLESTGNGVVIATGNVTPDLMGFSLNGDGGGSDSGILVNGMSWATTSSSFIPPSGPDVTEMVSSVGDTNRVYRVQAQPPVSP